MKIHDPGHIFSIENYPPKEENYPIHPEYARESHIQFRKRIGEDYPGNTGLPYSGTTTQELLRVIIERLKYVDNQIQHKANQDTIERCQHSIFDLEMRAAERRGKEYLKLWIIDLYRYRSDEGGIEEAKPCPICGHIFCRKSHAMEQVKE